MPKFLTHQTKQPHRQRREQNGIDPVEDAAVAGDDLPAVLHTSLALEEGFNEVAHQTEDLDQKGHHNPLPNREFHGTEVRNVGKPDGERGRQHAADEKALPGLAGGDARGQLMLAEQRSTEIGERVGGPYQDEEGQRLRGVLHTPHKKEYAQRQHDPNQG